MKYIEFKKTDAGQYPSIKYVIQNINRTRAMDRSRDVFGIRGKRIDFEVGQQIRLTNLYTGKKAGTATVETMLNGYPYKIKRADGTIELIFGYIIELLPILLALWEQIKNLFRKKDKK